MKELTEMNVIHTQWLVRWIIRKGCVGVKLADFIQFVLNS